MANLLPILDAIRNAGATTLEAMSQALNQRGIRSARGGRWRASSVASLLARARQNPSPPLFYRREISRAFREQEWASNEVHVCFINNDNCAAAGFTNTTNVAFIGHFSGGAVR